MKHMRVVAALFIASACIAADDADGLEKAARKDVPDAIQLNPPPAIRIETIEKIKAELDGNRTQLKTELDGDQAKILEDLRRAIRNIKIDTKGPKEDAEAREKIKAALEQKLTFEITDTPLEDALAFLKTLTKVDITYDFSVLNAQRNKTPVRLNAADMQLEAALTQVSKQTETKWEIRGTAIVFVVPPPIVLPAPERMADRAERKDEVARDERNAMPKLHAKLADGTEIEADAPLLNMPGVGAALIDRIVDPAKDGILVFRLGRDMEPLTLHYVKMLLPKVGPHCTVEVQDQDLVLIQSESPGELRKVQAIIRAMRPEGQRPPPPGGERGRRPPGPPPPPRQEEPQQLQPKKAREDAPGQF